MKIENYINGAIPENKQQLVMFQYSSFLNTLEYLKSETKDKFIFNCFIKALRQQTEKDLKELLE